MKSIKEEIGSDKTLIKRIQDRLPKLFQIAEVESSRAGKVGMQVGSAREGIIVALLIYKFGEDNVNTEIPITQAELDVKVHDNPISIKTLTSQGFAGVKLIWTVDAESAFSFSESYEPTCDMIFVRIHWENDGGFYYIPIEVQQEIFKQLGKEQYIKLPKPGTNPRGVEITAEAMEQLVAHAKTLKVDIRWTKQQLSYNPVQRWVQMWQQDQI